MVNGSLRKGAKGCFQSQENLSTTAAGRLPEILQDGFAGLFRQGVFLGSPLLETRDPEDLAVPIHILQAQFGNFATAQAVGCQ